VFALHGVHGMAVPTALTVQSTVGVKRTAPVFPSVVAEQLLFLLADIQPSALKLGMLATDDIVLSVAGALDRGAVPRVVDPVFRASDGSYLLEQRALGRRTRGTDVCRIFLQRDFCASRSACSCLAHGRSVCVQPVPVVWNRRPCGGSRGVPLA
jgi:hypothetical protein